MISILKKFLLTCAALLVYRIGIFVTLPYLDSTLVGSETIFGSNPLLLLISQFSAGRYDNGSIFALGISPFITASIICQLFFMIIPTLIEKKKIEGNTIINKYTRVLTVPVTIVQSIFLLQNIIKAYNNNSSILSYKINLVAFSILTILTLLTSTMFLVYLSDMITTYGLGSGASLIIVTSIISDIGKDIFLMRQENSLVPYFIVILVLIGIITFIETGLRQIPLVYPHTQKGMKVLRSFKTNLPIKINQAGVTPPMFALTIKAAFSLALITILGLLKIKSELLTKLGIALDPFLSSALILAMSFIYTNIMFNPKDVSDYLQKPMGIIPNIRPGVDTSQYINYVTKRLTLMGGIYICLIVISPGIIGKYILNLAALSNVRFTGSALIITIVVILETFSKVSTQIVTSRSFNTNKFL